MKSAENQQKTHLLAIDPGKASGFVVLDITQTLVDNSKPTVVDSSERTQMDTCYETHQLLGSAEEAGVSYRVVIEDFIITTQTGKKADTRYSLEIIGAVRYFCAVYGAKFTLQKPSEAKAFVSNDRLRSMDLWVPGGEGHAKDAMRHAVYYMAFMLDLNPEGMVIS